ncbi:unnamed protein product [Diatraea saccharalis]|uniref:LITAF domain-containing protein n=1 Tax=Diatraea saccharalis TaxID=40085 RepID=A0A9N9R4L8_9NEOP|nr:unnamed protein product [Diatraea saccharalis]
MVQNSINFIENHSTAAELHVQTETIDYREPPPPYSVFPNNDSSIVSQPTIHQTIIVQTPLQDKPTFYNCNNCRERVLTKVEKVNTRKTHMLAGFICGLTCYMGLVV